MSSWSMVDSISGKMGRCVGFEWPYELQIPGGGDVELTVKVGVVDWGLAGESKTTYLLPSF